MQRAPGADRVWGTVRPSWALIPTIPDPGFLHPLRPSGYPSLRSRGGSWGSFVTLFCAGSSGAYCCRALLAPLVRRWFGSVRPWDTPVPGFFVGVFVLVACATAPKDLWPGLGIGLRPTTPQPPGDQTGTPRGRWQVSWYTCCPYLMAQPALDALQPAPPAGACEHH